MPEGKVIKNQQLRPGAWALEVDMGPAAAPAAPGQFVHIRCGADTLLRRPISICKQVGSIYTLVLEEKGAGTRYLAGRRPGDVLDMLGPLGRGFDLSHRGPVILVGGGIGVPPLLYAAMAAFSEKTAVLGFRSKDQVILEDDFRQVCDNVYITTDDGSYGEHGLVSDVLARLLAEKPDALVLSCGPKPMLRAVAGLCMGKNIPCQVSLEERMGCGIGACLVCACKVKKPDGIGYGHVCKDGPVFWAEEVVWDA